MIHPSSCLPLGTSFNKTQRSLYVQLARTYRTGDGGDDGGISVGVSGCGGDCNMVAVEVVDGGIDGDGNRYGGVMLYYY